MDEFNIGDVVYYKYRKWFGRIEARECHRKLKPGSALKIRVEEPGKIWYVQEHDLIKVDPDTPQNRLAIQIKYG